MPTQFTDDDVGKRVVDADGEEIGMVADVDHGTAHVEPDPGMTDTIKAKLGWSDSGEDTYPLQEAAVDRVTDDEVRLDRDTATSGTSDGTAVMDTDTGSGSAGQGGIDRDNDDISGQDDQDRIRDDDDGLLDDDDRNR